MSDCDPIFDLGSDVRVTARFVRPDGTLVNPTTVTLKYQPPGGDAVTLEYGDDLELLLDADGKTYYSDIDGNVDGRWQIRWISTGAGKASIKGSFVIAKANIA